MDNRVAVISAYAPDARPTRDYAPIPMNALKISELSFQQMAYGLCVTAGLPEPLAVPATAARPMPT